MKVLNGTSVPVALALVDGRPSSKGVRGLFRYVGIATSIPETVPKAMEYQRWIIEPDGFL